MVGWQRKYKTHQTGFTLVELIIVISVIGILAAITIVGYGAWKKNTAINVIKSDLNGVVAAMEDARNWGAGYPTTVPTSFKPSPDDTLSGGSNDGKSFCVSGTSISNPSVVYYVMNTNTTPQIGACPLIDGAKIQIATTANCPSTMIRAVDARDNHSYWIQKLSDGRCWMLTNLAYGGGGINTYGDVIPTGDGTPGSPKGTLSDGTSDGLVAYYDHAKYYVLPSSGTLYTYEPTNPSTDQTGGGSGAGRQYGYLYNFCAANAGQSGNGACSSSSSAVVTTSVSICPAGWRLPTGGPGGEFTTLNQKINNGVTNSPSGILANGYFQYSGSRINSFNAQGSSGYQWSNVQSSAAYGWDFGFGSSGANPMNAVDKSTAITVRCIAN